MGRKKREKDYTDEQVERGLEALARNGGSGSGAAAELLAAKDSLIVVPEDLYQWKANHPERFRQLEAAHADQLEERTVQGLRSNAHKAAEVAGDLLDKIDPATVEDVPGTLKAVADVQSKSVDKLMAMTGRTPEGHRNLGMEELLRAMAAKGLVRLNVTMDVPKGQPAIDGTAEEETSP